MEYYPVVVQAITGEDKTIVIYFSDGRITQFDMKPLINQGGIFQKLQDDDFYNKRLTVMNDTAAWDLSGKYDPTNCIDIDPVVLYNAKIIQDPLEIDKAG